MTKIPERIGGRIIFAAFLGLYMIDSIMNNTKMAGSISLRQDCLQFFILFDKSFFRSINFRFLLLFHELMISADVFFVKIIIDDLSSGIKSLSIGSFIFS